MSVDAVYQVTASQGLRVGTEITAMIPEQIALPDLDLFDPNRGVFGTFVKKNERRKTIRDFTGIYHEDDRVKLKTTLRQANAAAGTVWYVAAGDGEYCQPWGYLYNLTKQTQAQIVSVSNDDITVLPNIDSAGGVAGEVGDVILILGPSTEEGTDVLNTIDTEPKVWTNYITNIQTPITWSLHAEQAAYYYGNKSAKDYIAYKKRKKLIEHLETQDMRLMFSGAPRLYASTTQTAPTALGNKVGNTMGFWYGHQTYAPSTHKLTVPSLTEYDFINALFVSISDSRESTQRKLVLAPIKLSHGIMQWNIGRSRFMRDGKFYSSDQMKGSKGSDIIPGLTFSRYEIPGGQFDIVRYVHFEHGGTTPHMFMIVDKERIGHSPYGDMKDMWFGKQPTSKQLVLNYYHTSLMSVYTHFKSHVSVKFNDIALS